MYQPSAEGLGLASMSRYLLWQSRVVSVFALVLRKADRKTCLDVCCDNPALFLCLLLCYVRQIEKPAKGNRAS